MYPVTPSARRGSRWRPGVVSRLPDIPPGRDEGVMIKQYAARRAGAWRPSRPASAATAGGISTNHDDGQRQSTVPQIRAGRASRIFQSAAGVDLSAAEPGLMYGWPALHGEMHYMAAHGSARARPAELVLGIGERITARMDYLPRVSRRRAGRPEFDRPTRPRGGHCLRLRPSATTTRRCACACKSSASASGMPWARSATAFTDSAPVLRQSWRRQRSGLARQAHVEAEPRGGLDVFPGREIYLTWRLCSRSPSPPTGAARPAWT